MFYGVVSYAPKNLVAECSQKEVDFYMTCGCLFKIKSTSANNVNKLAKYCSKIQKKEMLTSNNE
jgi:hypothetical protein